MGPVDLIDLALNRTPKIRLDAGSLYMRPLRMGDYTAWSELRRQSRDFLTPWEPTWPRNALSRSAFRTRVRRNTYEIRQDLGYSLVLIRRSDKVLLGGVTLSNIRRGVAQAGTLGYWIGQPYARQGHMTEALLCLIGYAAQTLRLHRLEAACLPSNVPSQRLLMKCGFVEEGRADGYLRINGVWHDHLLFGLVLDSWRLRLAARADGRDKAAQPQAATAAL
ncbi:MAG: GNAT family N-acetyltransferase [Alphaproteobacteria bacterium]